MADNGINETPTSELLIQLEENEEALQNLIFQKSMQQLEDLSQIKKVKKKISRIKTIIHEKELNIEMESDN
ncbi:MAG: 50S ribosomal protein L29 [Candidatus Neomarinimicrobiota bacterium]|jgi:ribosomal protein L29|nr:50S ribosomal protein L29 [Candidatus Neomarinimicrobiota bacterium]MED5554100.1 50S ribosomal protein L29 [Candidatus Neomarinimicrobiota bacterium]|tara:strand:- start:6098 stop:6310 length:213 start_codon:yes stop_codon:yes gene_type:complete